MAVATRTHGLCLGKFAPLHAGHQHLIETALREVDHLTILIYDAPEVTAVPLPTRAQWLRDLYPAAHVVEAVGGPSDVGDEPAIRAAHERFVIDELGIDGITHFYSGEFYGAHMSRALGAIDRRIDPHRTRLPISATQIRSDPLRWRHMVHPRIYRDLIVNVALLGAPSTGKTTLAARLATRYATTWMPEYGREYWEQHHVERRLTPEQLIEIAERHLEREERRLGDANRFLFTDTTAISTLLFARDYHGTAPDRLERLARASTSRYHLTLVCDTAIPYEDSWDRSGPVHRERFQASLLEYLDHEGIAFHLVSGTLDEREARVDEILGPYRSWPSAEVPTP